MKWDAIPARYDLWFVLVLAGLGWVLLGGAYVYFAEPYLVFEERRVSDQPETFEVTYKSGTCPKPVGEPCVVSKFDAVTARSTKIVDGVPHTTVEHSSLILALPLAIPCPEDTGLAVDGNEFLVTGYPYESVEKNILTGSRRDLWKLRIDVVAWEVVGPYAVSGENGMQENMTGPVVHEMLGDDRSLDHFPSADSWQERNANCLEMD